MKLISWNVNGIRAAQKKGFLDFFKEHSPEILCLQETRVNESQLEESLKNIEGYHSYWFAAQKKGYSGVAIYTKEEPVNIITGLGEEQFDSEGRVIIAEYKNFFLLNGYFPNSQHELKRLDYKLAFNNAFLKQCEKLHKKKPIIFCGDLNVAHEEIDLANPKRNEMNPGFYIDERNWFTKMLKKGYVDTFRLFNKEPGQYSWWSYRFNARAKNIGWRIDYFITSEELRDKIVNSWILSDVFGSDHCPIGLDIKTD